MAQPAAQQPAMIKGSFIINPPPKASPESSMAVIPQSFAALACEALFAPN